MLLHDNAKPHVAKVVRRKMEQLNCEVLPYPSYSPDLDPADYHLFRSFSNYLKEKQFDDLNQLKNTLNTFFLIKLQSSMIAASISYLVDGALS